MHPLSLEETWMTTSWENHVFCFLLAITIVNVQNAAFFFCGKEKIQSLHTRRAIAQQFIYKNTSMRRKWWKQYWKNSPHTQIQLFGLSVSWRVEKTDHNGEWRNMITYSIASPCRPDPVPIRNSFQLVAIWGNE